MPGKPQFPLCPCIANPMFPQPRQRALRLSLEHREHPVQTEVVTARAGQTCLPLLGPSSIYPQPPSESVASWPHPSCTASARNWRHLGCFQFSKILSHFPKTARPTSLPITSQLATLPRVVGTTALPLGWPLVGLETMPMAGEGSPPDPQPL